VWFTVRARDYTSTSFVNTYGVAILFTCLNFFLPPVIKKLVVLEEYASGKAELQVTIIRVYLLRILSIYGEGP
jgi:hypothetical protein